MEEKHLHLLIHEEIYLLSQDKIGQVDEGKTTPQYSHSSPVEGEQAHKKPTTHETEAKTNPVAKDHDQESPHIPMKETDQAKGLPFAIFHDSTTKSEIALLKKIIAACNLPEAQYKIFENGFDREVKFKKALVFISEAKAFYTPIPYKGSEFLCSKPLSLLIKSQQEKAKLWESLQKFLPEVSSS